MDVDALMDAQTNADEQCDKYAAHIHQQAEELNYMGKTKG